MAAASSKLLHLHLPFSTTHTRTHYFPSHPPLRYLHFPAITISSSGPACPVEPVVVRAGYNVQIVVDESESEESVVRRFRREVAKAGVIQECKRRRYFENKQEAKKRKHRDACRRNRRRRFSGPRTDSTSQADADAAKKATEDEDDNWDLPESDLPY